MIRYKIKITTFLRKYKCVKDGKHQLLYRLKIGMKSKGKTEWSKPFDFPCYDIDGSYLKLTKNDYDNKNYNVLRINQHIDLVNNICNKIIETGHCIDYEIIKKIMIKTQ